MPDLTERNAVLVARVTAPVGNRSIAHMGLGFERRRRAAAPISSVQGCLPDEGATLKCEWDEWQHDVAAFVLEALPSPPRRVLDVGCGTGWLVRALDGRDYDAHGVDPQAPEGDPLLTRSRLEEFEPDNLFDVVLAVLPLHHIDDLDLVIGKIVRSLVSDGLLLCVEFTWDRFDDDTARWCLEHLPAELDDHNWLHELCLPLRERHEQGRPLGADELVRSWAAEHGFHASTDVLKRLRERFVERHLEWGPYLYPDLAVDALAERTAIADGRIAPMSFRFIGKTDRDSR